MLSSRSTRSSSRDARLTSRYFHVVHTGACAPAKPLTLRPSGYGSSGERLVAGIVPLSADKKHVLLISSTRRSAWVLPKGGWETDEATQEDAAKREAWEEAGIVVKNARDLGDVTEKRSKEQMTADAPYASYRFFEATVEKTEAEWPEMKKRDRKWMTYKAAAEALKSRPELAEALEKCSMDKSQ